ncbi:unnamed protein product (macronuclear) [Paramecium tetraurelia]|uniref:Uncharacterized protein n=1 Tax=Paramecium tetraurelia TaxID=5888 RepID=A0C2V4_PARTE|nr:uncharacterized protein GSPATT00034599001 [Paramecium tetraurelia]CAK65121.1 unnamed protein product [Paramecium tetraurelia]|eukprot:XP_001432518.1 hypothetical protein (macronuclear) [Paramecium tetraurelia strain d4-2]
MNNYVYGQNQQVIIQQLFYKIEQLMAEIQKLTNFSNQLIMNLQTQENQYNSLKRQFNDVWAQLNEQQKIWFNLKNNTQHYTLSNEAFVMSNLITDIKSRVSEIKEFNLYQNDYQKQKKCQLCSEKDYTISNLKAQLKKQAEIVLKLQFDSEPTKLQTQNSDTNYSNQRTHTEGLTRQRFTSQKLFQSNLTITTAPGSKY